MMGGGSGKRNQQGHYRAWGERGSHHQWPCQILKTAYYLWPDNKLHHQPYTKTTTISYCYD